LQVTVLVSTLLCARRAAAQKPTSEQICAEAIRIINAGATDTGRSGWLFTQIVRCAEGPNVIAARWRAAHDRSEDLKQLLIWNQQLRDQRIAEAAIGVARDASRPIPVRLTALQALVTYFDPSASVGLGPGALDNPPPTGSLGHDADVGARLGSEPPAPDLPDRIYRLNRDLVNDATPAVARAARYLWQALTDARPKAAALGPGSLVISNVCGRKFRVDNRTGIDLSVEVAWSAKAPQRQHRIPAGGSLDMTLAGTDTVRLLFAGHELGAAVTGSTTCR